MRKHADTDATLAANRGPQEGKRTAARSPRTRAMSLEKAKKLIRKTSAEHQELFRRLAQ